MYTMSFSPLVPVALLSRRSFAGKTVSAKTGRFGAVAFQECRSGCVAVRSRYVLAGEYSDAPRSVLRSVQRRSLSTWPRAILQRSLPRLFPVHDSVSEDTRPI